MEKVHLIFVLVISSAAISIPANGSGITFPKSSSGEPDSVGESSRHPEVGTPETLAHHVANMGLKAVRDLLQANANVIISPLNIYSCLEILGLGAAGKTRDEILGVLGPRNSNQDWRSSVSKAGGVSLATALFLDHNFVPKPEFSRAAASEYLASVLNVNMSKSEETKNFVNRWVSDQTNGTINDLLQGQIDPYTKMIVVSALLFNGRWLQSFSPSATTPGKFQINENSSIDVQLMHLVANISVVRNPLLDAIGLPYQSHGMKMYMILPKAHGISGVKKLLSHLNVNSLRKLKSESVNEEILMIIPKLTINGRFSLGKILKQLGISSMFNPSNANFTNMVEGENSQPSLSEVYHSVHFEMNEEGTVASAATASILTKSSKFVFKATRPFIIVITNQDDLSLFMGAVVSP